MKLREHVDNRLIGLRVDRFSWWTHWRELADYILPRRYKWLITPNQATRGSPINQRIIDSTGTLAMRVLAAGMMSGLTSPSRPWFRLATSNVTLMDDPEVKAWCEEAKRRMLIVMAESNFYNGLAIVYQDLAVFGTGPMIIYEDFDDVIRVFNTCAGEYYLANNNKMKADTLYREFVMTTVQVVQEFGLDNVSPTVRSAMRTGGAMLTQEIRIGHAIEPNADYVPKAPGTNGFPYREVYWELGTGRNFTLRVTGYHECPFIAPRWDIVANDAYGRSPGMDALGDIKQLQVQQKRKAQAIDKHVNPPLLADISLKNEPATMLPGGVTYVAQNGNGIGMKPVYEIRPDIQGLSIDMKEVQGRINSIFYKDLFLMISQIETVRSATEIDARKEEKLIQLGPVIERFENEGLSPAIDRVFNIMHRAGLLPPLPRALKRGAHIKVEYISMLAEAQKAVATAGIERLTQYVGGLAAVDQTVLDNIDFDETIQLYADDLGVSPKVLRSPDAIAKLRQMRQQQMAQQQAQQNAMAAVQGAQTLSDTDVGGGKNALQLMTQQ
jgi:hypothetical protein